MANNLGHGITTEIEEILVILDNCAAHLHLDFFKNIQMDFLSPNITSLIQT
jgi:hypothetical protein